MQELRLDSGIVSAIVVYFTHGLYPGSCAALLLKGKYKDAKAHAHPMIKKNGPNASMVWDDMVTFVKEYVPECCRNENFSTWLGFETEKELQPELATFLILQNSPFVETWVS